MRFSVDSGLIVTRGLARAGDIRRDFLRLAGVPEEGFDFPGEITNGRINAEILEYQRLVNRLPLSPQQKRGAHKELIALTAQAAGTGLFDDRPLLGAKGRAAILARHAKGNATVARTYLKRKRHFDDAMPRGLPRSTGRTELSTEKLVYILGCLIAQHERVLPAVRLRREPVDFGRAHVEPAGGGRCRNARAFRCPIARAIG